MTRRHRRVDAPGTGAAADRPVGEAEPHLTSADQPPAPVRVVGRAATSAPESARDRWLKDQRPPHWGRD